MEFNDAMQKALQQRKYDALAGRLFDWKSWLKEQAIKLLKNILGHLSVDFSALFKPSSNEWLRSWVNILYALIIILLVFVAVKLAVYIGKLFFRHGAKPNGIFEGIDKETSTPDGLLGGGARLASEGYLRDAVRYCLAAVLLALDRKKIYRLNYTKTNGQIVRDIRYHAPPLANSLAVVVDVFNAVWFGHRGMTGVQFENFWRESSALVAEVDGYKKE